MGASSSYVQNLFCYRYYIEEILTIKTVQKYFSCGFTKIILAENIFKPSRFIPDTGASLRCALLVLCQYFLSLVNHNLLLLRLKN